MKKSSRSESGPVKVEVFGLTHPGQVRKNNEDNFTVCNLSNGECSLQPTVRNHTVGKFGTLLLVADGMGGESAGEIASQICTATVPKRLYDNLKSLDRISEVNCVLLLREAIEFANQVIQQQAQSNSSYHGMGTTATACVLFRNHLFVAQVGDSRAYLVRKDNLVQLTSDQTFLNYLADIGQEMPEGEEKEKRKSILTQAVGTSETLDVRVTYADVRQGDWIVVCSDGLHNMVESSDLLAAVSGTDTVVAKCQSLIDLANKNGGKDNITVILSQILGSGLAPADEETKVEAKEFREEDFQFD